MASPDHRSENWYEIFLESVTGRDRNVTPKTSSAAEFSGFDSPFRHMTEKGFAG
jgi:hypothetical protein